MMVCLLGASRTQYGLFTSALFRSNPSLVFCCNLKVERHIFIWKNFALSATELEKPSASHMNYKCTLAVLKLEFLRSQSQTEQVTRCQSFFFICFIFQNAVSSVRLPKFKPCQLKLGKPLNISLSQRPDQ